MIESRVPATRPELQRDRPETISLEGPWSFTTDPQDRGEHEAWFERTSGFGRSVPVPSPWQLYGRDLIDYTGAVWYYRACGVPERWAGKRVRLSFGASDYHTKAWVNGRLVGEHEGGHTPFAFDITDFAAPGAICHVVVRVYDPADPSEIPHGEQGRSFTRVSGIWQGLGLEARPEVFIAHVAPVTKLNPDRVEVVLGLSSEEGEHPIHVALFDATGLEVATLTGKSAKGRARLKLEVPQAKRWSPDDPHLYRLVVRLGEGDSEDVTSCHVGIRDVAAIDGRLYLNGQPLFLRGAVDHGYWADTLYMPPSDEEIQREIRLAKEAGLNVLRKHGKIEDPRYLDWCDRLGMLIWAEVPSASAWTPQARRRFLEEMKAMLRRDAHRPSLIAWSLCYENRGIEDAGEERRAYLRSLYDEAAEIDPTRPICTHAGGASMRTDMLDEHRRYALPEEARELKIALEGDLPAAGAPRLVSEFGGWGLPGELPEDKETAWWVDTTWWAHPEPSKRPRTAEEAFERFKLAAVFEDLGNLSKLTQRRLTRGVKGLVEELRRLPAFAGYVGRGFADTEWEASGWLTYDRQPKLGFDEWAAFNGPIAVLAELPRRNYWCGETIEATLYVSNHSKNPIAGTIQWGVDGADCDGEVEFSVEAFATVAVGAVNVEAPAFAKSTATKLSLKLLSGGWEVNANTYEITLSPPAAGRVEGRKVAVVGMPADLADRLSAQGYDVHARWEPGMPLIAGSIEPEVRAALDAGANVVFLAEEGAQTANTGFLSFRPLPQGDSWERTASVHYIQWDLFPQLPLNTLMGWEMEDLFPQHVVPLEAYGKDARRFLSNQVHEDSANVLAGYFEGWLGNFSASMLVQSAGRGRLLTTTLRLGSQYGAHPIATQLLNRLLTEAHLFEERTVYQLET